MLSKVGLIGCLGFLLSGACGPTDSAPGPNGSAAAECASGTVCGTECVDLMSSSEHCGACGASCSAGETCLAGSCEACLETTASANQAALPADIIVVVDNSGSMSDEAGFVQNSMNDFVAGIVGSGIDAHVILISSDSTDDNGICVPAPVGSGSCPGDEKLPGYRHVVQTVSSSDSLQLVLSTYDQWSSSLRPGASRTIVVISDDDSALAASPFAADLVALDPTFAGFRFSAIVAPYDLDGLACFQCTVSGAACGSCDPCCGMDSAAGLACTPLPADEGRVYKDLVATTGGVLGNLCTQDFGPVFDDVATAVVDQSSLPCSYVIPEPPNGENVDVNRVNVDFQLTPTSPSSTLPHVADESACGSGDGWYYDSATDPTRILLCPKTCDLVKGATEGAVAVKFGCSTITR